LRDADNKDCNLDKYYLGLKHMRDHYRAQL